MDVKEHEGETLGKKAKPEDLLQLKSQNKKSVDDQGTLP